MLRRFIKQMKVNFADRSPSRTSSSNKTRRNSDLRSLILGILKPPYESLPFTKKRRNVEIRNYAALLR